MIEILLKVLLEDQNSSQSSYPGQAYRLEGGWGVRSPPKFQALSAKILKTFGASF
jgi:hypothetical protein